MAIALLDETIRVLVFAGGAIILIGLLVATSGTSEVKATDAEVAS
jgi:hypothetical protein